MGHKNNFLQIQLSSQSVSGILDVPNKILAGITLAHGAGAGMLHPFLAKLAASLSSAGFAVLRFQFPYMENGLKRTDSAKIATETVAAAVNTLREKVRVPVFAGGKSFGARMTTTAAAEGLLTDVKGIVCFGFPLHTVDELSIDRATHLVHVENPILFLQGTRDKMADLELMKGVCSKLSNATLNVIDGADHGFGVLRRSGRTEQDVIDELVKDSVEFSQKVLSSSNSLYFN